MAKSLYDAVRELRVENARLRASLGERSALIGAFRTQSDAAACARHERDVNKRTVRIDRRYVVRFAAPQTQGELPCL